MDVDVADLAPELDVDEVVVRVGDQCRQGPQDVAAGSSPARFRPVLDHMIFVLKASERHQARVEVGRRVDVAERS
jgi:hypothetical protein